MNPATEPPPDETKETTGSEKAQKAVSMGVVSLATQIMLQRLYDVLNFAQHTGSLRYRLGAAMMICNAKGIMAGRGGGNQNGTEMKPTSEEKYRKSATAGAVPSENLPTSLSALRSEATMTEAPPEYGDSQLAMVSRSAEYNPTPLLADFDEYAEYTGPVLAPRGMLSRTITNYGVSFDGSDQDIRIECGWDGIFGLKSGSAQEFLSKFLSDNTGRDLRGYTEYEARQAERQINAWMIKLATGRDYD